MLRDSIIDSAFGEPANIDKTLPLEQRLFSEVMMKIYKLEQSLANDETIGLQISGVTLDLKECRLIQGAGLVLFAGVSLQTDGTPYQPEGIFLCVQPLFPLNLTLLVLRRANVTKPRRKIGFSIQGQAD